MGRRTRGIAALVIASVLATAACGNDVGEVGEDRSGVSGTVLVFAAASLTDAFAEIGEAFEDAHPGMSVELSFAGSSSLREQLIAGAPADVFASASIADMDQVIDAGEAEGSRIFARNLLQIAVPSGNPGGVTGLDGLADPELFIGLCAEQVPCGQFARQVLDNAGVVPSLDTAEPDVRALLTKIEAGELDAGIVYVTDVVALGEAVEGIAIPDETNVVAPYPIATLTGAPNREAAEAFVAFVLSAEGQAILAAYGFEPA